jgi:hypothetical protein
MNRVFILQPSIGGCNIDSLLRATQFATQRTDVAADYGTYGNIAIGLMFNVLWSKALNAAKRGNATHCVMLHNDVVPEQNFVDKLLEVMERRADDLVSVAIPIKDSHGLYSCGLIDPEDQWAVRRFASRELFCLPETFAVEDTVTAGLNNERWPIAFNTGCWIADLRNPKWYELDDKGRAKFFFTMNEEIVPDENGDLHPNVETEDFFFSRLCAREGIKYSVTREVKVKHFGPASWSNEREWGDQLTDEVFYKRRRVCE